MIRQIRFEKMLQTGRIEFKKKMMVLYLFPSLIEIEFA